jgi:chorismate dehydratase
MQKETFDNPKSTKPSLNQAQNPGKHIGVIDALEFQPLLYGIKNKSIKHPFELIYTNLVGATGSLRDGEAELSLIPSVEYARTKETWNIIPGICINCPGSVLNVQLFFKKGLKDLKKIAIDNQAPSAATLLKILLREKYSMSPDYLEMPAGLEHMLDQADAALICGDKALEYYQQRRSRLDLNEEWVDLTGLPFVYSFWAGREFTITTDEVRLIRKSFELGLANAEHICRDYAAQHGTDWVFYHDFLTKNISYNFAEREKEGLMEFYNYAFFYGYTEFIPDLHFYSL